MVSSAMEALPPWYMSSRVFAFETNSLVNPMHFGAGTSCFSLTGVTVGVNITRRLLVGSKSICEWFGGNTGRYAFKGVFLL